jgi:histidinol-phosphatase (PHP family)
MCRGFAVIADYHIHLRNERGELAHTLAAIEPFLETARAASIGEIGFTEHVYYFRQTCSLWTVPYHTERCVYDLWPYVEAVVAAKRRGFPVKLGLEVDYVPGREPETGELLAPYPWDYLLGSIHFIDGFGVDGEPRLIDAIGVEGAWRRYYEVLRDAATSGLFDSLSHPDLVKMFGRRPDRALEEELHEQAVESIAAGGVAVEASTAGLARPVRELYPDPHFLSLCRKRGVVVTTASDAHQPAGVGRDFDLARKLLRGAGYATVTLFERRAPRQVPLDD